jgi:RNA polymerase sigma-70 factor (ECF subfamily)
MSTMSLERSWSAVEPTVRGYLHRRLGGDAATSDDLTQEVFLRLRRNLAHLRAADRVGPWASRIAHSVLIDHVRRRRASQPITEATLVLPGMPDGDAGPLPGLAGYARAQVDALPSHEAVAIRLVDLAGIAPAEAATRLAIGLPALKARLRRGRERLRQAMDRCCDIRLDGRGHPMDCEPRRTTDATECCGANAPSSPPEHLPPALPSRSSP